MYVCYVLTGYRYGKSLVPITEDDEAQMKVDSERCLSLLGFSPQALICPQHTIGTSVQVVMATPGDAVSDNYA